MKWIAAFDALPLELRRLVAANDAHSGLLRDGCRLDATLGLLVQGNDCIAEGEVRLLDAASSKVGDGALSAPARDGNLGLGEACRREVCQYFFPIHIGTISAFRFIVKRSADIGKK